MKIDREIYKMMGRSIGATGGHIINTLVIMFIVLKITGLLDISWFWVFSPLIIGIPAVMLFSIIIATVMAIIEKHTERKTS